MLEKDTLESAAVSKTIDSQEVDTVILKEMVEKEVQTEAEKKCRCEAGQL